jgi:hypothetical protein
LRGVVKKQWFGARVSSFHLLFLFRQLSLPQFF